MATESMNNPTEELQVEEESSMMGSEWDLRDIGATGIETLSSGGISNQDIAKLKEAGICTVQGDIYIFHAVTYFSKLTSDISTLQGLVLTSKRQLLMIKGLSDQKIMKCLDIGRKNLVGGMSIPGQYATGLQVMEMRKSVRQITTGSAQFDSLLGGGFESQSLTEIYGEFRTGKTQVSHTLCVTGQLGYDIGGGQGKVLFIDTEVWFRIK